MTKAFPREELYGLTSQIRRAAVSIPSNIAEGHSRNATSEFHQFLGQARGSLSEVETQLRIAENLGYVTADAVAPLLTLTAEIGRIITGLRNWSQKKS